MLDSVNKEEADHRGAVWIRPVPGNFILCAKSPGLFHFMRDKISFYVRVEAVSY